MNAHLSFKTTKIVTALLLISQLGLANAAEPIILNNATQLDNFIAVGVIKNANGGDLPIGEASMAAALGQAIAIDSHNIVYTAYMDKADHKAYVMKLVDNKWLPASTTGLNGVISEDELSGQNFTDNIVASNRSVAMVMGNNNQPYLAYVDIDGAISVHTLQLDSDGNSTTWQLIGKTSAVVAGTQYLRLALDSTNTPYLFYGTATTTGADLILTKLVEGAWVNQGDRLTTKVRVQKFTAKTFEVEAGFAISADDVPYIAFDSNQNAGELKKDQVFVQKLIEIDGVATWTTVGSRKLNTDFGNIRALEMAIAPDGTPYVLAESFPLAKRLMVAKFSGETNEDHWQVIGKAINVPYQNQNLNTPPIDMKIQIDNQGVPYVIYQDFNMRPATRIRVLRLESLLIDDVLTDVWQEVTVKQDVLTSTTNTNLQHLRGDVAFDNYNRPHIIYQDVGGTNKSRVLRAAMQNSSDTIAFSVLENTIDAGLFDIESNDDTTLVLSGRDADAFDPTALLAHKLVLKEPANFEIPSYSLTVTATNTATSESTAAIAVKVTFKPSDDPDLIAQRAFAFSVFNCATPCPVDISEGQEVSFESIKSKIDHIEIAGDLPDGVTFALKNPEDSEESFGGTASYISAGEYDITLTAFPIEGAKIKNSEALAVPVELSLTITVANVAMAIEGADYSVIQNEKIDYLVVPTSIAYDRFTIDNTPSWAQFNGINGELMGTPSYTDAGSYSGIITAHGFDNEEVEYPFEIVVDHVPLNMDEDPEQELTIDEDKKFTFTPVAEAARSFSIENKPDWAVFDSESGELSGKPSFEDEGDYSFTITAQGFDEEPTQSTTINLEVVHVNAPPRIAFIPSLTTEEGKAASINVMQYIDDVDSAELGDKVSFVMEAGRYQCDGLGEFEFVAKDAVITCDGLGLLEQVSNGFIYTPAFGDKSQVTITFTVTDDSVDGPKTSTGTFGVNVLVIENKSFDQSSSGGSMGALLLSMFGLLFGARTFNRKAS